ncbi:hypothetical protein AGMMS49975_15570 [Clostridia bacterium]|nr:hypothetical protein AGMMS49975_15570 [Clostridia bacterium]GHU77348.1 hypothetical protein FACS1894188_11450 [Clostridia bacterium]
MREQGVRGKRALTPFGIKVRNALNERNMEIKDLAGEIGICCAQLSEILRGKRPGKKYIEDIEIFLELRDKG